MAITLEEIAKRSNVSRATVSRVINGYSNVREETRKRVLEVIEEVNFQPNLAARSLAAGRTNVIGLVIPAGIAEIFSDPWFPQVVNGISTACNVKGYSVMLWLAEPEYERQMITRILHSGLLDGVIVSSMSIDDPIVKALHASKMPFVLIGRHPTLDIVHVDVDNFKGGYDATKHLLDLGNKKIGIITGPQNLIAGIDRFRGYKSALQEAELTVEKNLIYEGDFSEASGYQGGMKLIKQHPDALFVSNDTMALGTLRAMRDLKIKVPDELGIVGFDDIPNASSSPIPLTTVRQPTQAMGRSAVNTLFGMLDHKKEKHQNRLFATELVIRESCGALLKKNNKGGDE